LPENFDSRVKWPECIYIVRNQGNWGSWWAHALAETLSFRYWSMKGKLINLSPQDPVSWDKFNFGWNGGFLDKSW